MARTTPTVLVGRMSRQLVRVQPRVHSTRAVHPSDVAMIRQRRAHETNVGVGPPGLGGDLRRRATADLEVATRGAESLRQAHVRSRADHDSVRTGSVFHRCSVVGRSVGERLHPPERGLKGSSGRGVDTRAQRPFGHACICLAFAVPARQPKRVERERPAPMLPIATMPGMASAAPTANATTRLIAIAASHAIHESHRP
jgi:hypothetical protein